MKNSFRMGFLIMLFCFAFTACGRRPQDETVERTESIGTTGSIGIETSTLTVAAPSFFGTLIQEAGTLLQEEFASFGIQIDFSVILYTEQEAESHAAEQYTLYSMGGGADIFFVTPGHPMLSFINEGFLADINELIDMYSNRDYFFTNVLDAMEIDGVLYTFPLNFAFEYVGINAALPPELIERFAEYESITLNDLFSFHINALNLYPELYNLALGMGAIARFNQGIHDCISESADWKSQELSFPTIAFVQFLNNARPALTDNNRHNTIGELGGIFGNPTHASVLSLQQERYMFSFTSQALDTANALLNFHAPYFKHYVPLAGVNKELFVPQAASHLFSVSKQADGRLAIAFLRHLAAAWVSSTQGELSLATPIERALFAEHTEAGFVRAVYQPDTQSGAGSIPDAVTRLEHYLSLPVTVPSSVYILPAGIFNRYVSNFLAGEIPPMELVEELENQITYWLETATLFEIDYDIAEARAIQAARAEMPVRELSVFSTYKFNRILRQAADAVNQDWADRDVQYNFALNLTTYSWQDSESEVTRLIVMLMAGQGYDMFYWMKSLFQILYGHGQIPAY